RVVNVEMIMLDDKGEPESNNARYFYEQDIITIAPFKKSGIPMAINGGVIAHEYFHSVFERLFVKSYRSQSGGPPQQFEGLQFYNEIVLRSWNEGLADFYAYLYLQTADLFGNSVQYDVQMARKLDLPVDRLSTADELQQDLSFQMQGPKCTSGFCVAYQEGSKISRFLYTIWNRLDTDEQRWQFVQDLLIGLRKATESNFTASNTQQMDLRDLVPFIANQKWVHDSKSCEFLLRLMGETEILDQYSECSQKSVEAAP
ncbi:MAG: hypothetical protein KDD22_01745, partial [Bdellovibrionales bacterium]|nr:hypothetical protein [Bdellovibrionales bacterium]